MKKILMILLLGMFFISFTSALIGFEDVKDYNKATRTVTIRNSVLFIPTTRVAEIQLISPLDVRVERGYRKVAEFKITGFTDYDNFISQLEFYDVKNNMKEITRSFDLKVKEYEEVLVNDYETQCIKFPLGNGTIIDQCNDIKVGSHLETQEVWVELTKVKKGKEMIVGIFTEVLPGDKVDWVPTFAGVEVPEWAVWTEFLQEYYAETPDDANSVCDLETVAQTFTPGNVSGQGNFTLKQVSLNLTKFGSPGTLNMAIRATAGASPTGADLSTGSVDGNTISSGTFVNVSMTSMQLIEGVTYALWIEAPGGTCFTDRVAWVKDRFDGAYDGGKGFSSTDGGSSWGGGLDGGATDFMFKTWGVGPETIILLNSPANNSVSSNTEVTFNATSLAISGLTIINMSLWTNETGAWEIRNVTTGLSDVTETETWVRTYDNADIIMVLWGVEACDSDNNCTFSTENRTLTIEKRSPIINIQSPNGTLDYNYIGGNETLNTTFVDINLDTCWYNYNGTNITIEGCVSEVKNTTIFILEENNFNITISANDTIGNENSTLVSWDYKVLEINQTFNELTTEGATETFLINFTKSSSVQISTVGLVYDGAITSSPYLVSGDNITAEASVTIPSITSTTNVTFYWNITLDDGSTIITKNNNQTISTINIDNCSTFTNLLYQFNLYDEEDQTILGNNNTMEVQINLFDVTKTTLLVNFSKEFKNTNPAQVCLEDPLLTTVTYSSYVIVKYHANLTTSNKSYTVEYYNILNQTISNTTIPKNITLYNLEQEKATKFRLTFRDGEYVLAPNILVQVHRQYIRNNNFEIVEIPITDSNGQTILNLVKDNIVYNFIMVDESGTVVGTFNSIKAFCQDFVIGDCTISLAPDSLSESPYDYDEEFDISLSDPSYDNNTKKISMNFITGDLSPKNVLMEIVRNNQFGNRSVCSDSLFAASGTLSCSVSDITDTDQFLFISTFVNGDLAKQDTTNLNSNVLNFGIFNGAFYAFLMVLFIITMFMEDRKVLVISLGLGWVAIISLGLMNGKLIGLTSAGIWILISIGIFLWKLNSEESL